MTIADQIKEVVAIDAEARRIAAAAERIRVRRELLAAIGEWTKPQSTARQTERSIGASVALGVFVAALDRICPEEG